MTPALPALLTAVLVCSGAELPQEPAQRTATLALQGRYGALSSWQREGYTLILQRGATVQGTAWVTHYWAAEGPDGRVDCYGNRCTLRTAAANLLPRKAYVWVSNPCQIRQVLDCGARRNDRIAQRKGADVWIDLWTAKPKGNSIAHYTVVTP
jgi:hypothetical protein